jgi:hypothetical protein
MIYEPRRPVPGLRGEVQVRRPRAASAPAACFARPTPAAIRALQRTAGNGAVSHLVGRGANHDTPPTTATGPTAGAWPVLTVSRQFEREQGRPVRGHHTFVVPDSREAFARTVAGWCDDAMRDDRAPELVAASPSFDLLWESVRRRRGERVEVDVEFVWATSRVEELRFLVPMPEMQIPGPDDTGPTADTGLPAGSPRETVGSHAERISQVGQPADLLGDPSFSTSPGQLAKLGALSLYYAAAVPQMARADKAAGLGAVDYAWTLASWITGDQSSSTHGQALRYAEAVDDWPHGRLYTPTGDDYRTALASARSNAERAFREGLSAGDRQELRRAFPDVDSLAQAILREMSPRLSSPVRNHAEAWDRRWRENRSFFRNEDRSPEE